MTGHRTCYMFAVRFEKRKKKGQNWPDVHRNVEKSSADAYVRYPSSDGYANDSSELLEDKPRNWDKGKEDC